MEIKAQPDHDILQEYDVYSLAGDALKAQINKLPKELVGIDEEALMLLYKPTRIDRLLRLSFWAEFSRACRIDSSMEMHRIYKNICSKENFNKYVMTNNHRLSFLLIPPANYRLRMENLLDLSMTKLEEIMELPIKDEEGNVNSKLIGAIIKAALSIRDTVKGAAIQRVVNVNANIDSPEGLNTADDIDKKILALKEKMNVIEVKSEQQES